MTRRVIVACVVFSKCIYFVLSCGIIYKRVQKQYLTLGTNYHQLYSLRNVNGKVRPSDLGKRDPSAPTEQVESTHEARPARRLVAELVERVSGGIDGGGRDG